MIERVLIVSFSVFAIWYTMLEGEIFGALGKWFNKHLPIKLHSPVYECPVCMIPYYGTAIYWIVWGNSWQEWFITCVPAMGLNAIIVRLWPDKD